MYTVIKKFIDAETKKIYMVGDEFPTKDVPKERIDYLKSENNKLGEPVIKFQRKK